MDGQSTFAGDYDAGDGNAPVAPATPMATPPAKAKAQAKVKPRKGAEPQQANDDDQPKPNTKPRTTAKSTKVAAKEKVAAKNIGSARRVMREISTVLPILQDALVDVDLEHLRPKRPTSCRRRRPPSRSC